MDRCIVVNDFHFDNYDIICEFEPTPDKKPVGAYLSDIRNPGRFDDIVFDYGDEDDGVARFMIRLSSTELTFGTWTLRFILDDGSECPASFRNEKNPYKTARLIELSSTKMVFNPDGKIYYMGVIDGESHFAIRKIRYVSKLVRKEAVVVNDFEEDELNVKFDAKVAERGSIKQAEIWLWSMALKRVKRIPVPVGDIKKKKIIDLDLDPCLELFDKAISGRLWKIFLVFNSRGLLHVSRLEMRDLDQTDKKSIYYSDFDEEDRYILSYPVKVPGEKKSNWVFQLYFNNHGELCAKFVPRDQMYINMYRCMIQSFKLHRGCMNMTLYYNRDEFTDHRLILRYCPENSEDEAVEYEFKVVRKKSYVIGIKVEYCLDFSEVDWKPLKYELLVKCKKKKENYEYEFKTMGKNDKFYSCLSKVYSNAYFAKNGMCVFVSENTGYKIIFECRKRHEYDSLRYRFNEFMASFLYNMSTIASRNDKYLMFYEKFCTEAQDNSYYMFEYLMENEPENYKPVYVIEKSQSKYKELKELYGKNVVPFMSIRHLLYIQRAAAFVSTDSIRHCYKWRSGSSKILRMIIDKKFVFLQHGVLGFKRVDYIYGKQFSNKADLFISSSEYEKKLIYKWFGYDMDEIAVTGLARWDKLVSAPSDPPVIFYMPTWRKWINEEIEREEFIKTEYFNEYSKILASKELADILEKSGVKLVFCMHPKFRQFDECIEKYGNNISIFDYNSCNINEMLMKCNLFITDYSSAAWDVYYMDKPVLFYQFDVDKYIENQGAYVNLEKTKFGDRVTDFDSFIECIRQNIENGFVYDHSNDKINEDYIPVKGTSHRQLIFDEIMKLLS